MLNETGGINVDNASMSDLKCLVDNIINTPLNESFENHIKDLNWCLDKIEKTIDENNTSAKKYFKEIVEDNIAGFDSVKESIESNNKLIISSVSNDFIKIEGILTIFDQKITQFSADFDRNLGAVKKELQESVLHLAEKINDIESILIGQSERDMSEIQLINQKLNKGFEEFKMLSLKFDNQRKENNKLYIGLIFFSVLNVILIAVLIFKFYQ